MTEIAQAPAGTRSNPRNHRFVVSDRRSFTPSRHMSKLVAAATVFFVMALSLAVQVLLLPALGVDLLPGQHVGLLSLCVAIWLLRAGLFRWFLARTRRVTP